MLRDGNNHQMAKQSHKNYRMKVVSDSNNIITMNYRRGVK
jgi:hypothetical protein